MHWHGIELTRTRVSECRPSARGHVRINARLTGLRATHAGQDVGAQGCHQECGQCVPAPCVSGGPGTDAGLSLLLRALAVSEEMQQEAIDCATQVRAVSLLPWTTALWAERGRGARRGTCARGPEGGRQRRLRPAGASAVLVRVVARRHARGRGRLPLHTGCGDPAPGCSWGLPPLAPKPPPGWRPGARCHSVALPQHAAG